MAQDDVGMQGRTAGEGNDRSVGEQVWQPAGEGGRAE